MDVAKVAKTGAKAPIVRTRTGCATCKRRKVKCDEERPACQRCLRGNYLCEGYKATSTTGRKANTLEHSNHRRSPVSPTVCSTAASPLPPDEWLLASLWDPAPPTPTPLDQNLLQDPLQQQEPPAQPAIGQLTGTTSQLPPIPQQPTWIIPPAVQLNIDAIEKPRYRELLHHSFMHVLSIGTAIDHSDNPTRTFVAQHIFTFPALLHVILAIAALHEAQDVVAAREEAAEHYGLAVDLLRMHLQNTNDATLATFLFLSDYAIFAHGTAQPEEWSRFAHSIIEARMEALGNDLLNAPHSFRFLVRFHVNYKILANTARRPLNLRSFATGRWTILRLLSTIEMWERAETAVDALHVCSEYSLIGMGVPLEILSFLADISNLAERRAHLAFLPAESTQQTMLQQKLNQDIRNIEARLQFARLEKLPLPAVHNDPLGAQRSNAVRYFELFRLATTIHILQELRDVKPCESAIQSIVHAMVGLLKRTLAIGGYDRAALWCFFVAGCAAMDEFDRDLLCRRMCQPQQGAATGNTWALCNIMSECWLQNDEWNAAGEGSETFSEDGFVTWKDVSDQRGWCMLVL